MIARRSSQALAPRPRPAARRPRRAPSPWFAALLLCAAPALAQTPGGGDVAFDGERGVILAPGARAVAVLPGAAGNEWYAALAGGGLLRRDAAGSLELLSLPPVVALAPLATAAGARLALALSGGGVFELDPATGSLRWLSDASAAALASLDTDGDGRAEAIVALEAGGVLSLDPATGTARYLASDRATALASGSFLAPGPPQLVALLASGAVATLEAARGAFTPRLTVAATALATVPGAVAGLDALLLLAPGGALFLADPATGVVEELEPAGSPVIESGTFITFEPLPPPPEGDFLRGDVNADLAIDVSDPIGVLLWLFAGGAPAAPCRDALDTDDSGAVDLSDAVYELDFLFRGGPPPPPPFPIAGPDPSADALPPCLAGA